LLRRDTTMATANRFEHCRYDIPVRHKRKVPFRPRVAAPSNFSQRTLELRRLDTELERFILGAPDYEELLVEAWAANIHRSVSVEGNPLSLRQVQKVARESLKKDPLAPPTRYPDWPRQEIVNHILVHKTPDQWRGNWTLEMILELHRFLLEGDPAQVRAGRFRDAYGAIYNPGGEETHINAPPDAIETELQALLDWRNTEAEILFPVAAAAVFFHEFESIHPFSDGNGRTGRVLFHIYLQTTGLPNSHLCLIEPLLMGDLDLYYRILGWTDQSESYTELVDFFTDALLASYRGARDRLSTKDLLSSDLDELAKRLLVKAKASGTWFTNTEAAEWADNVTPATIRRHLGDLVDKDVIEQEGAVPCGAPDSSPPCVDQPRLRPRSGSSLGCGRTGIRRHGRRARPAPCLGRLGAISLFRVNDPSLDSSDVDGPEILLRDGRHLNSARLGVDNPHHVIPRGEPHHRSDGLRHGRPQ
jgi:Fic family protein